MDEGHHVTRWEGHQGRGGKGAGDHKFNNNNHFLFLIYRIKGRKEEEP